MKIFIFFFLFSFYLFSEVSLGVDVFFDKGHFEKYKQKKIGIITNHTGRDKNLCLTYRRFLENKLLVKALFSPEHGFQGNYLAGEKTRTVSKNIPIYSLFGQTRRPTKTMLKNIDVLFFDIQDIGSRSYTYSSTLFYVMEEAKKNGIEVVVLDRPNPLGNIIDGPLLQNKYRSFVGYINVPYCHGMTIGELALYFNGEYKIGCNLKVIPMFGWRRDMSYANTGLLWVPTSPNIPEADTAFFYPSTGILGELNIVNIGIGYTMPFKIVGAPWIDAEIFSKKLNDQKLAGVKFCPMYFKPFYGIYKGKDCKGVQIFITDRKKYCPVTVQYLILGMLKSLYPKVFMDRLERGSKRMFHLVNGTNEVYDILKKERYPAWKLIRWQKSQHVEFCKKRKKYLLY